MSRKAAATQRDPPSSPRSHQAAQFLGEALPSVGAAAPQGALTVQEQRAVPAGAEGAEGAEEGHLGGARVSSRKPREVEDPGLGCGYPSSVPW